MQPNLEMILKAILVFLFHIVYNNNNNFRSAIDAQSTSNILNVSPDVENLLLESGQIDYGQIVQHEQHFQLATPWSLEAPQTKPSVKSRKTNRSSNKKFVPTSVQMPTKMPPSVHAVWDEYGKICILAKKFRVSFKISYQTTSGAQQWIDYQLPAHPNFTGRCDRIDKQYLLDVTWKEGQSIDTFRIIFEKIPEENQWGVRQMLMNYDTEPSIFRDAVKEKIMAKSKLEDKVVQFRTLINRSMLCPVPPPIKMYDEAGTSRVIARLSLLQIQAFEFKEQAFSEVMRCGQVSFGAGVHHALTTSAVRSDSLTFAVGLMSVFIASSTVAGYALYRARIAKKCEYRTMI